MKRVHDLTCALQMGMKARISAIYLLRPGTRTSAPQRCARNSDDRISATGAMSEAPAH
jgi:hypothetical protein